MSGFLGTGAPFSSDLNLVVQLAMGVTLLAGLVLARKRQYRVHKYCQASVMLLNLVLIGFIMAPAFVGGVAPEVPRNLGMAANAVPLVHAALGLAAELLGLFVVLVAATRIVPPRLRFRKYKVWMRTTLVLWWLVLLVGVGTYYEWYLGPATGLPEAGVRYQRTGTPDRADRRTVVEDAEDNERILRIGSVVVTVGGQLPRFGCSTARTRHGSRGLT